MNIAALKCKTLVRQFHHIVDAIGNEAGISYVVNAKTWRKIRAQCAGHCSSKDSDFCSAKLKEENPLLLQRQSHFAPQKQGGKSSAPAKAVAFSFGKQGGLEREKICT